jgi:hypothetical protein
VNTLPAVPKAFLAKHSEFGKPVSFANLPDWAHGKRVSVVCRLGWFRKVTYILYERSGFIQTVYRKDKKLGMVKVFGVSEERVYK